MTERRYTLSEITEAMSAAFTELRQTESRNIDLRIIRLFVDGTTTRLTASRPASVKSGPSWTPADILTDDDIASPND